MLNKIVFHRFIMYLNLFIQNKLHISSPETDKLN